MFEIEKNVPISGASKRIEWPWNKMKIGDSVEFNQDLSSKAQVRCHIHGRQANMKFKTRKQTNGKLRVWRIA